MDSCSEKPCEPFHSTYCTDIDRKGNATPNNEKSAKLPQTTPKKPCKQRLKLQRINFRKDKCSGIAKKSSVVTLNKKSCDKRLHSSYVTLSIAVTLLALVAGFVYLLILHRNMEMRTSSLENSLAEIRLDMGTRAPDNIAQTDYIAQEVQKVRIFLSFFDIGENFGQHAVHL